MMTDTELIENALQLKDEGNQCFKSDQVEAALKLYNQALGHLETVKD